MTFFFKSEIPSEFACLIYTKDYCNYEYNVDKRKLFHDVLHCT